MKELKVNEIEIFDFFNIVFFYFLGEEYESDESTSDIDDENTLYPNLSDKDSFSYGLRNTYDEPMVIRHDYKATTSTRNTSR